MDTHSASSSKSFNSADLAFIDAAIAMQRALQLSKNLPAGAPSIELQPDAMNVATAPAQLIINLVTYVMHALKGSITARGTLGGDQSNLSEASLQELIAKRNALAKALGMPSIS